MECIDNLLLNQVNKLWPYIKKTGRVSDKTEIISVYQINDRIHIKHATPLLPPNKGGKMIGIYDISIEFLLNGESLWSNTSFKNRDFIP